MSLGQRYFDTIVKMASTRWWRELVLTVGAVLGVVCIVLTVAAVAFDVRPLVFRSGSMAPTINTGDLAISRTVDAADLAKGDIVSVKASDGSRVTHRIVTVSHRGGSAQLTLKGDDNKVVDAQTYVVASAERVLFHVPKAGYVVSWLSGPIGIFLLGIYVAFLAIVLFGRGSGRESGGRGGARRATAGGATLAVLAAGVIGTGAVRAEPTWAAWTDTSTATGEFGGDRVRQPVSIGCQAGVLGLLSMKISTTSTDSRYEYVARIYRANGTQVGSDEWVLGDVDGTTRSRTFTSLNTSLGLLDLGTEYQMRVYAHVPSSSWYSTDYQVRGFKVTGVAVPLAFSCSPAAGAPNVVINQPADGANRSTVQMESDVSSACGNTWAGCATVTDNGSVASVEYILQRVGNTTGTRCWNGSSSWVIDCSFRSATSAGSNVWKIPRATAITYPYISDGTFTLTIRATDNQGLVTTSVAAFVVHY